MSSCPSASSARRAHRCGPSTVEVVSSSGEREFFGALMMIVGLLFWLNGAGYLSLWLLLLPESWSEVIGKVLMGLGAILVVSALA